MKYNLSDSTIIKPTATDNRNNFIKKIEELNNSAWELAPTNIDLSIEYADSAILLADKINWTAGKANSLSIQGEALRNKGQFNKSLLKYEESLSLYKELKDANGMADAECGLGMAFFSLSDFSKSFKHFDNALEIYKSENNKDGILNVKSYIGVVFSNFKQHEKAIEYFQNALELAQELGNEAKMAIQLNNLGLTYVELKEYQKAINNYENALKIFKEVEDFFNYAIVLGNIGIPHTELGNYYEARRCYEESLELSLELGDTYGVAHQYGNLGELFLKIEKNNQNSDRHDNLKNLDNSIKNLKLSIREFKNLSALEDQKDYLEILSEVYEIKGDYKNSLHSFKEAKIIQDSIQAKENQKVIANLEIKQELENKNKEIIILNKEKEYDSMLKTAVSILAVLIFFITLLVFYFYRKKKKDNLKLLKNIKLREQVEEQLRKNEIELTNHKHNLEEIVQDRTQKLKEEIIQHKETEEALLAAIERSEIASNAKTTFLANMSHELRTPLVGILGYSELLKSILEEEDVREMAEGINRTGNRLLSTLSMVLDLSRIESDKFEIDITDFDLIAELKDTYNNFKAAAQNKNLNITLDIHDEPLIINSDLAMIKVILDNLVNNAVKFTNSGEIKISTELNNSRGRSFICVIISDTGIGIKQHDVPLIFEEFKQLSEGFTKDFQGSGLGLSVTKKFVELLGGKIEVDSVYGEGTTFTLKFPTNIKAVA